MSDYETPLVDPELLEDIADQAQSLGDAQLNAIPLLPPLLFKVSGLYQWSSPRIQIPIRERIPRPIPQPIIDPIPVGPKPLPDPVPMPAAGAASAADEQLEYDLDNALTPIPIFPFKREELRLDTDGRYPQDVVSGTLFTFNRERAHWVANLRKIRTNEWVGNIWYKDGPAASLPYTNVWVKAYPSLYANQRKVKVRFYGRGQPAITRTFSFKSSYFHKVEFEYDVVSNTSAVTHIQTHAHPNRPASLPNENLTIKKVFQRAGFDVSLSPGNGGVPIAQAGADHVWTNMEMHDAMQTYWSRFADRPQWAMWVLFAARHQNGSSLGGIMFDSIGPNHRQGTAMFNDSFISNPPAGDAAPAAWVERMKFWTAVHEMGHAFNLAHSWQKHLGTQWIPLTSNSEARSFMNYPYFVSGGQAAFFADFGYRFIDEELLFMRHAPSRFVQMGNENWFSHHGLEQDPEELHHELKLEVRANREKSLFEYLEPVSLELKLSNTSEQAMTIDRAILEQRENLLVLIKQPNGEIKEWHPFAHMCLKPQAQLLDAQSSIYATLPLYAGTHGWNISEPGRYEVIVLLEHDDRLVQSNRLTLSVLPPRSYDEQVLAQDFFSDEVGRTLAFGGTNALNNANDTLHELVARLPGVHAARHATMALAQPQMMNSNLLDVDSDAKLAFKLRKAHAEEGMKQVQKALLQEAQLTAQTLGHIAFRESLVGIARNLAAQGDKENAKQCCDAVVNTLQQRQVPEHILGGIRQEADALLK